VEHAEAFPRFPFWAASGLIVIMIGAIYSHLTHDEATKAPIPLVAGLLLAFVARARRPQAIFLSE
jgi:hypothetical protein